MRGELKHINVMLFKFSQTGELKDRQAFTCKRFNRSLKQAFQNTEKHGFQDI